MSLTTSEKTDKLFAAYFKARSSMKELAPTGKNGAFKTSDGKVATFAPLQTIQRHIEGPFFDNDLLFSQSPTMTPDGMMVVTTLLLHAPSSQWMRGEFALKPDRPGVHGQVACSTYGRRVALAAMLNLLIDEPSDDDGNIAQGIQDGLTSQVRTTVSGIKPPTATPKGKPKGKPKAATLIEEFPTHLQTKGVKAFVKKFEKAFPDHVRQLRALATESQDFSEFKGLAAQLAKDLREANEQPKPPIR
jgi:hypothetical protein